MTLNEPAWSPWGTGEALGAKIRVTITAGRVSDVHVDPRALGAPSKELAGAFRDATNAAIEAHNEQASAGLPNVSPPEELARTLEKTATDAMRVVAESSHGIRDAIAAVQRVSELHRGRSRSSSPEERTERQ